MTNDVHVPKSQIGHWLKAILVGRNPRRTSVRLAGLLIIAAVAFVIFKFVFVPIRITGPSMFPTYDDGQINFINRFAYWNSEPQRGDVVAIRFSGNNLMYVKRIVGLPGELIFFKQGRFEVNGQPLTEPYLRNNTGGWDSPPRQLGPQEYYVVGDNRSMPYENHDKGGAERRRIIGKILRPGRS